MAVTLALYTSWRASAPYRVRLALAWKGLSATVIPVDLRTGEQSGAAYRARNPQGLVPVLIAQGIALTQSLAIIEYLEELHPQPPLLPTDAIGRARVRAAALMIAADIHPVNNLRVMNYLSSPLGHDQAEIHAWARHWIAAGLEALEAFTVAHGGTFLHGDALSVADLCLVPQLYNARRFAAALEAYPRLLAIEATIVQQDFAIAAHPDNQPDAMRT